MSLPSSSPCPLLTALLASETISSLLSTCIRDGETVVVLVAYCPSNVLVYLRDGSAQTIAHAATQRKKSHIKLSISPSHSILTPDQPVPVLILNHEASGRVVTRVPV